MRPRFWIVFTLATVPLAGQWVNYQPSGTPLKNGKPDLTAPVPRRAGKPDLTGVWMHESTPLDELKRLYGNLADEESGPIGMEFSTVHKYGIDALVDFKPGEAALTPAGDAALKKAQQTRDVTNVCHNRYGWPVAGLLAEPMKIVQAPKVTMILYEVDNMHRQVFTDGRRFPEIFELPARLGYSIGRWDGDTFVIESRGFNDETPIDAMGHPRSDAMHVTERIHRRDYGHLDTEITFDDPKYYTRPFTEKISYNLDPENDIFEMYCDENEKDRGHMVTAK